MIFVCITQRQLHGEMRKIFQRLPAIQVRLTVLQKVWPQEDLVTLLKILLKVRYTIQHLRLKCKHLLLS